MVSRIPSLSEKSPTSPLSSRPNKPHLQKPPSLSYDKTKVCICRFIHSHSSLPPSLPSFLYPLKKEDDDEASISDDDDDDESDSDKETSQKDIEIKVQPPSKSSLTAPSPRSVAKALLMDPDFNATLMLF